MMNFNVKSVIRKENVKMVIIAVHNVDIIHIKCIIIFWKDTFLIN